MALVIEDMEQHSPEWFQARCGSPGASSISNIIGTRGELSKSREGYLYQLAGEIITGKAEDGYINQAMQNGIDREPMARSLFEMQHDCDVKKVGIVYKDEWKLYHCSPDGLVGDDAGIEIKCPSMKVHVGYLFDGKLPTAYFGQVMMSMYVSERSHWFFMSHYDGLPALILKIERDEEYIAKMAKALDDFCADLQNVVKKLRSML